MEGDCCNAQTKVKIILLVASSGVATLLSPFGKNAHAKLGSLLTLLRQHIAHSENILSWLT